MENEKRLIDAERFKRILQNFEGHLLEAGKTEAAEAVKTIIKGLKTEPTVDAVEVVRCDDCIHYKAPDEGDYLGLCTSGILSVSHNGEIYPGRGFFCLYGERKA